jgi:hypothetical protein
MTDEDPHDQISRLETRIEELADKIEWCRKIRVGARGAIAAGSVLMVAMLAGVVQLDALPILGSLVLLLGGLVTLGSNSSTQEEATTALRAAEAERSSLIGGIDLRVVGGSQAVSR